MQGLAAKNKPTQPIGMGWYNTILCRYPTERIRELLLIHFLYPYQTEVLTKDAWKLLMNFQTAVCDLTGMPLANCSLLDEATAAAEAVTMMYRPASARHAEIGRQRGIC